MAAAMAAIDGGSAYKSSLSFRTTVLDLVIFALVRGFLLAVFARRSTSQFLGLGMYLQGISLIYSIVKFGLLHFDSLEVPLGVALWALLDNIGLSIAGLTFWSQERSAKQGSMSINDEDDEAAPLLGGSPPAPTKAKPTSVPAHELFRFASNTDLVMLVLGTLSALAHGVSLPVFMIYFGSIISDFSSTVGEDDVLSRVRGVAVIYLYLGAAAAVTSYFQVRHYVGVWDTL